MRVASGTIGIVVAVLGALIGNGTRADAATCGDANRTGSVTVTDGVLVLRAAAQLPSVCADERCDMNLDSNISVTDGVLALRVAAGIETQVACSSTQADTIFGTILKSAGFGSTVSPAGRARAAGTTSLCADGGFVEDDGTTLTFTACQDGDFVTDGTLTISDTGPDTVSLLFDTSDFVASTGETITTFGVLDYTFNETVTQVDGTLSHTSSLLGAYTDQFSAVLLDADFLAFSGTVVTVVTEGVGVFANLSVLDITIFSPTLAQIGVSYMDGDFDVFTLADGLCEPCSSGCKNASLTCLPCGADCNASGNRCTIDFDFVDCDDGFFGPSGLCEPCGSNADCDASEGLSCFACAEDCSGDTLRCGSSKAFVECVDGAY